jgi:hypothetical protein
LVQHRPGRGRVMPVTRVLDGVGWYSGGIIVEGPICFGKSGRSMMAVPSGDEDGMRLARTGSVTLLSARLVWMRGTMA